MTKIDLELNIGNKFDEGISQLELKIVANWKASQELVEEYNEKLLDLKNQLIVDVECQYDKQVELTQMVKEFNQLQQFLAQQGITLQYQKDEAHLMHFILYFNTFNLNQWTHEYLKPLGITQVLETQIQKLNVKLEMNQDMGQTIELLNKTDSGGQGFLRECRTKVSIEYDQELPKSVIQIMESIGFHWTGVEWMACVLGQTQDIELSTSFQSPAHLPPDIQNYLFRLPQVFKRGKQRVVKQQYPQLQWLHKYVGHHVKVAAVITDVGLLQLDLKGPNTVHFLNHFLGIFDY